MVILHGFKELGSTLLFCHYLFSVQPLLLGTFNMNFCLPIKKKTKKISTAWWMNRVIANCSCQRNQISHSEKPKEEGTMYTEI